MMLIVIRTEQHIDFDCYTMYSIGLQCQIYRQRITFCPSVLTLAGKLLKYVVVFVAKCDCDCGRNPCHCIMR